MENQERKNGQRKNHAYRFHCQMDYVHYNIVAVFLAGDSKHSNICLLGSGDTIKLSCNEQIAYIVSPLPSRYLVEWFDFPGKTATTLTN